MGITLFVIEFSLKINSYAYNKYTSHIYYPNSSGEKGIECIATHL